MAEHILVENNHKKIPLLLLRPSIISASLEEPVPGWTDSIGIIGGIYMLLGLGILRELPCDENNIGDQVPVDIVVN
jgi:fatty acyl-CoA reductase